MLRELRAAVLAELHRESGAFSAYRSFREQRLVNVPLVNPVLMVVLSGSKAYGDEEAVDAQAGTFLLVAESQNTQMRNIPIAEEYLALLIEFDWRVVPSSWRRRRRVDSLVARARATS
ncbi:MAG: hypothetical protein AAFX94_14325, partial [Myxococcota bacterium]